MFKFTKKHRYDRKALDNMSDTEINYYYKVAKKEKNT